jgi:hypothetical protein
MRKASLVLLALVFALPLSLSAETWKNVSLMDGGCAKHAEKLATPDAHTKECALKCAKAGYGTVVDGKFIKFDKKGDELAKEAIMKSDKKDHLRANVTGELKGGEIHVASLKLE